MSKRDGLRLLILAVLLYSFFLGLELMGLAFKLFGGGLAEVLIAQTTNPFAGLFIGILATSLMQSSSSTTSITVAMVAANVLTVEGAVPIIMGANIGTSVTNTLVSLGHVTRPEEFRRAFAGATLHDFFNWLAVLILLPVEIATGYLARTATMLERMLEDVGGTSLLNPIKFIVKPVAEGILDVLGHSPVLTLLAGVGLLFMALKFLVDLLRGLFSERAEQVLHNTLFRSAAAAILAGAAITVMVQSSSITTSTMIPLVGAGVVTLEQLFPFTIGANIGTTVTAILAALAAGSPAGIVVALSHLLFNVTGALLIYGIPLVRRVPLAMSRWLGNLGVRNRLLAISYIILAFYVLPLLTLIASGTIGKARDNGAVAAPAEVSPADERP